jgi:hypothetical protein
MQQSYLIGVPLARRVSGDFAHHQERRPVYMTSAHTTFKATPRTSKHTIHKHITELYFAVQNTTCCNDRCNAPEDGRKGPKNVEQKEHQNHFVASSWLFTNYLIHI